jgi:hypothetical protein
MGRRNSTVLGFVAAAAWACCAGGKDRVSPRPAETNEKVQRALEATVGVALRIEQEDLPDSLAVKFILINETEDRSFWINSKLPVGHHSDYGTRGREIEMVIMDSRRRRVLERCTEQENLRSLSDFVVLRPGEKIERVYDFNATCYDLARGEKLLMIASYKHLAKSPDPPRGTYRFSGEAAPKEWKEIVVPSQWRGHN